MCFCALFFCVWTFIDYCILIVSLCDCHTHSLKATYLLTYLLNLLISHPFSDLCTGSRLMNALNINSSHSPTKFLQPANLYLHNLISVQSTGRTRSSSLVTLARPSVSSSPTALSRMHHLTCGISSLLHSVNLIPFTVILVHLILHIITSSQSPTSLPSPITASTFHSRLKTHLFHKSFPP